LAHLSGSLLLHPRYMFFADRWNKHVDWSRSRFVTKQITGIRRVVYLEKDKADQHGNRKWNLRDGELSDMLRAISSIAEDTIVHLPFDQSAGKLMHLASRSDVREDLNRVFLTERWQKPDQPYVCIHIRRGDCTPEQHKDWYVADDFYINLITRLDIVLPKAYPIIICTQGRLKQIEKTLEKLINIKRVRIQTTPEVWTNDAEVNDFQTLANAEILITARSTFSRWAGLIGPTKCVVDVNRQSLMKQGEQMVIHPEDDKENWGPALQELISNHVRRSNKELQDKRWS